MNSFIDIEAIRFEQRSLSFIEALKLWAEGSVDVKVSIKGLSLSGHLDTIGEDWIGVLRQENEVVIVRISAIDYIEAKPTDGSRGMIEPLTFRGCLMSREESNARVGLLLVDGTRINGHIGSLSKDHLRLTENADDIGEFSRLVPTNSILALWNYQ